MPKILLVNVSKSSIDVDLPDTGREHEIVVHGMKKSDLGIGNEVVTMIKKVHRPDAVQLHPGDDVTVDERKALDDPVIASRIRCGVLSVRKL